MLRRHITNTVAASAAVGARQLSTEHKDITLPGAPQPPMISQEPAVPIDFNPHIEWYEFPKEIFDHRFPYTREECVRATEESYESTMDELASRYGMKLNFSTKPTFWMAWMLMFFNIWYTLWAAYRASGGEPKWPHFRNIVAAHPKCPTIDEDDIYLDQWINPGHREVHARNDNFWNWKPLVNREGATKHQWSIPVERKDPSEWIHMTSKH